ncbi:MAG: TonB-dependent receptor [Balneolaceae bacterium]
MTRYLLLVSATLLLTFLLQTAHGQSAAISGMIQDTESGEDVAFAYIHLEEINRTTTSNNSGSFSFRNVPNGTYTLVVHRIGYVTQNRSITVTTDDEIEILIQLRSTILTGQTVEVIADSEILVGSGMEHASVKITGDELRQDLGTTLSETLESRAGFSQRTMGVAPGRPVIRGLGDLRVEILQDGGKSSDVSWTSADHAVSLDPSSAEEIQVARGPAAFEYGANALGGVINVVKNRIPNTVPTRTTGVLSAQGVTVNRGLTGASSLNIPFDPVVVTLQLNGRTGQDFRAPGGRVTNTGILSSDNALGIGYIKPWGYAGLSGSMYYNEYGIPPNPDGGHAEGVNMEMVKYQGEGRSEVLLNHDTFNLLELRGGFTSYHHAEIEDGGIVGTEYRMISHSGSVKIRNQEWGFFESGLIGIDSELVDYSVFGSRTPNSTSGSAAVFAIQEIDLGDLHLESGLRYEYHRFKPDQERNSPVIGHVRERTFQALASSIAAIYNFGNGYYLGTTLMHSFRPPSVEELYSEGPHLAAYSYEVGNPDLSPERALGSELFARYRTDSAHIEFSAYYNYFNNYIHPQDTGEPNHRLPEFNNWQFVGARAAMYGTELDAEIQLQENLVIDGTYTFTIGNRTLSDEEQEQAGLEQKKQPLPMIPPMEGGIGLRYAKSGFSIGGRLKFAAAQNRTAEFESATSGYTTVDLKGQYRFSIGNTFHTLTLNIRNLMNTEYYNHLSRIKEIFPEPGRSADLLYRIYF